MNIEVIDTELNACVGSVNSGRDDGYGHPTIVHTVHGVPVVLIDPPSKEEVQKLVEAGSGRHFKLVPVD